jgi:hypothetical protein
MTHLKVGGRVRRKKSGMVGGHGFPIDGRLRAVPAGREVSDLCADANHAASSGQLSVKGQRLAHLGLPSSSQTHLIIPLRPSAHLASDDPPNHLDI